MYPSCTVTTTIASTVDTVWKAFTTPEDIMRWNAASDDWCCPSAANDLRPGGRFVYTMAAKDDSFRFDFSGTFDDVVPNERLTFTMDDDRRVEVRFTPVADGVLVTEIFDAESTNPIEMQQAGWQAILDSFKRHVER